MKILLDADGSPVREICERLCQKYGARLLLVKNYSQDFLTTYGEVISVDISKEAADIYIANHAKSGDLVITNDKGLSSLALSKKARVMDFQGKIIDDDNIIAMLESRHFKRKMRERQVYFNIAKRDNSADEEFYRALDKFLEENNMLTLFVSSLCQDCPPPIASEKETKFGL